MHYYEFVTVCKNQQKSDHNQVYGTKGWGFELLMARQNRSKSFDFDLFFLLIKIYVGEFAIKFRYIRLPGTEIQLLYFTVTIEALSAPQIFSS